MIKILHISKYYFPFHGGIEQTARDCILALQKDCSQKLICFNHERGNKKEDVDGIDVIRADCFSKIASQSLSVSYPHLLRDVIRDFEPDIVVFHYPNPYAAHFLLKYLKKNTKLIIYWHLDIIRQKVLRLFFIRQNKELISRAYKILVTSPNYVQGSYWLKLVQEKCQVLSSCISVSRFERTETAIRLEEGIRGNNTNRIICFAVGRHTKYKGFSYLIRASKFLDDRFRIYIAGFGDLTDTLKKEAAGNEKIIFLGELSDIELEAYMSAMDIFCFPSITRNEAFGLTLVEAMYHQKPSVTFTINGSGVNYVSLNGVTGIEVPNRDVKAYAHAMRRLADDPALREKYGKAAKERVLNYFFDEIYNSRIRQLMRDWGGVICLSARVILYWMQIAEKVYSSERRES